MNCQEEFLDHIKGIKSTIHCASLRHSNGYRDGGRQYKLPVGFTYAQYSAFLSSIDFDYDNGFSGQELYGTIWYSDGTWSDRREYDGSEWWEHQEVPLIPEDISN